MEWGLKRGLILRKRVKSTSEIEQGMTLRSPVVIGGSDPGAHGCTCLSSAFDVATDHRIKYLPSCLLH